MKNTMKKKIAEYILASLPEYDSKDSLNVKLIKGKAFTVEELINTLRQFDTRVNFYKFSLRTENRRNDTESYSNYYACSLIKWQSNPNSSYYKRNSEDSLLRVLGTLNPELQKKIIDLKVNKARQDYIDKQNAINN